MWHSIRFASIRFAAKTGRGLSRCSPPAATTLAVKSNWFSTQSSALRASSCGPTGSIARMECVLRSSHATASVPSSHSQCWRWLWSSSPKITLRTQNIGVAYASFFMTCSESNHEHIPQTRRLRQGRIWVRRACDRSNSGQFLRTPSRRFVLGRRTDILTTVLMRAPYGHT